MKIEFSASGVILEEGQFISLGAPEGVRIVAREGVVWITLDGDPRDIVLQAGEAHVIDGNTRAIVEALEAASISVIEPARLPQRRGMTWIDALRTRLKAAVQRPATAAALYARA